MHGPEWRAVPVAAGWAPGSESLALPGCSLPVPPWCGDDARRRLRGTRSHGQSWCPGFPVAWLPAHTCLPAGDVRRRARVRWLGKVGRPSLLCSAQTASRPSGDPSRSRSSLRPCRPRVLLDGSTRRGGGPFQRELWARGGLPPECSPPCCSALSRQEADAALTRSRVLPVAP
jgi:hypothetical protein